MNKHKLFNLLYVVLIIGVILFMVWIVFWLKSEGAMCMNDPLGFVAEKLPEQEFEFDICMDDHCYKCKREFAIT